jgi:hypothetical protein
MNINFLLNKTDSSALSVTFNMVQKKKCNRCGIFRLLSEFHKCSSAPDEKAYKCKICSKELYIEKKKQGIFNKAPRRKICKVCGIRKNIGSFYKQSGKCKVCHNKALFSAI